MADFASNNVGMDWNDTIENDGQEFIILPEGDYNFTVSAFERGCFPGSAKMQACNKASLTLSVETEEGIAIDHITVVSNSEMVFHFADGREISHGWQKLVRPRPRHTEEYKAYMSRLNKERWTDERRQRMSEIMKTMRKEESYRWQKQ